MIKNANTAGSVSVPDKKIGGFFTALDKMFHVSERGSTISREVLAGIGAFFIAVVALLLNTQLLGTYYGNYAGTYFAISLVAFLGTTGIGIAANLPVMQTASITMSTLIVTYLGKDSGLTYSNLLLVTLVSAVIALLILVTPLHQYFLSILPTGVQKALPVAIGLYVILSSLQKAGIIGSDGTMAAVKGLSSMDAVCFWIMIAGVILFLVYQAFGRTNAIGSTYFMIVVAMWVIGIVWFMDDFIGGQTATTLVYQRVNLIFATDGASPYNVAAGISSLNLGAALLEGMDFTAFSDAGGNVGAFLFQSISTFTLMAIYTGAANIKGAAAAGNIDYEGYMAAGARKALIINAVTNIIGAMIGAAPQSIASESAIETKDGGRTGLTSLTAGVGLLLAVFTWAFFAVTATTTNGVGMWINDTETKLAAYVQDTFVFAALIMVIAGICMLKAFRNVNTDEKEEIVPFLATVAGASFTGNIVIGIAIGLLAYVIIKLVKNDRKSMNIMVVILSGLLSAYAIITLYYGSDFVTVVKMMGGPPM